MSTVYHIPVMVKQVIDGLSVKPGGLYVDCTVGEGGHAKAILEASQPGGVVLGMDRDPVAVEVAERELRSYGSGSILVNKNYACLQNVVESSGLNSVDGVLFDLGLSSLQLEGENRGFSFKEDAFLDMRFDPRQELTAWDVVNRYSRATLARVISDYGEEPRAARIADGIVKGRPIDTSLGLAEVIRSVVRRTLPRIHPATRTFQAIRMEVNRELDNLRLALSQAISILNLGGRLAVISYHSLEDRLVKYFFREESGSGSNLRLINKKVIPPSREEVRVNFRSRSARMRVAERI
jgi:16S rRNA (cytosine1402-N4)-methyltransferase